MQAENLVAGKQYWYDGKETDGMDWLLPNSVVTVLSLDGSQTPPARGIAHHAGVGGTRCAEGAVIDGFVRAKCLHELPVEAPAAPVDYHVSVNPNSTTIVIQKRLSIEEVQAVIKAAGA
jgi:hypothetical protein